ncbi:MAG: hypothetical protein ACT4SY_10890 [Hyphomicrobiales bacterium]
MSKFMLIVGVLLAAVGVALGLMVYFSPGQMQVVALTPDVAAILLVGGVLAMGLGGVIAALENEAAVSGHSVMPPAEVPAAVVPMPQFDKQPAVEESAPAEAAKEPAADISPEVSETIAALEKAKSDINAALAGPMAEPAEPAEEKKAEEEPAEQLFVVEERVIRGRPARILSDGTVEAETDEGWMRFENLEHLDEYLDAMAPSKV